MSNINDKLIKEGILFKRGYFNRYNNKYQTLLDEISLKCIKVGKTKNFTIELTDQVEVVADKKSKKQFKVKSSKKEIFFRAETEAERDDWVEQILKVAAKFVKDQKNGGHKAQPSFSTTPQKASISKSQTLQITSDLPRDPRLSVKPKAGVSNLTMTEISDMLKLQDSQLN